MGRGGDGACKSTERSKEVERRKKDDKASAQEQPKEGKDRDITKDRAREPEKHRIMDIMKRAVG